jgi:hypothetical protein
MEENKLHNDIFDNGFDEDLECAFTLNERNELKSLFEIIENQNHLDEEEIERAFVLNERRRLKQQFKEIDESKKIDVGTNIAAANSDISNYSVEIQPIYKEPKWKRFLIAASVIGLILTTGIWILNQNNAITESQSSISNEELVKLETEETKNQDSIDRRREQQDEFYVILNNSSYRNSDTIDITKSKQFGFGSNKVEKVKVVTYNINRQITILKEYQGRILSDSNYYLNSLIKSNIDSIKALKYKYTFDLDSINIYNVNSDDIEVYYLFDKYFLRNNNIYYELSRTKKPILLKTITDSEIINLLKDLDYLY